MKKNLLYIVLLSALSSLGFSQSAKLVFLEEFTQASCPPCEATTPAFNAIVAANDGRIVQLRYHTSFPGVDPMHDDNPDDVNERQDYYPLQGVPTFIVDGTFTPNNTVPTQIAIDNAANVSAPVAMTLTHTISDDLDMLDVQLVITNEGTDEADLSALKLRVALAEEEINWPYRPGSTSLVDFEFVMKKFVTSVAGMDVDNVPAGGSITLDWSTEAPATVYDYNSLAVVAMLQDDSNRNIVQGALSSAQELSGYADFSVEGSAEFADELCDLSFTPSATVKNESSEAFSDVSVNLVINGDVVETATYTDPIMGGEEVEVMFTTDQLSSGTSSYVFEVVSNSARDIVRLNNLTQAESVAKIDQSLSTATVDLNFEDAQEDVVLNPNGIIITRPFEDAIAQLNGAAIGSGARLGGLADSDYSILVFFWNWNPATFDPSGSIFLEEQVEIPTDGAMLSFDHAYTSFQGSPDRLRVNVSSDCGVTSTSVFDKAGSDLRTSAEVNANNAFFFPTNADDWVSNNVDLSAFAGQTVLVSFEVESAWGDNLYIDNISVDALSSVNDLTEQESIEVYPNPVQDILSVDFNISTKSNVKVSITNAIGQQVLVQNLGEFSGKAIESLDVSNLDNGIYNMYIQLDDREVVKRFSKN